MCLSLKKFGTNFIICLHKLIFNCRNISCIRNETLTSIGLLVSKKSLFSQPCKCWTELLLIHFHFFWINFWEFLSKKSNRKLQNCDKEEKLRKGYHSIIVCISYFKNIWLKFLEVLFAILQLSIVIRSECTEKISIGHYKFSLCILTMSKSFKNFLWWGEKSYLIFISTSDTILSWSFQALRSLIIKHVRGLGVKTDRNRHCKQKSCIELVSIWSCVSQMGSEEYIIMLCKKGLVIGAHF